MSGYMPKVGDRVRATLGESVIVGEVESVKFGNREPMIVTVYPSSGSFERQALTVGVAGAWKLEQIVEVPTKIGAVIRRADGALWVRRDRAPLSWCSLDGLLVEISVAAATAGGFTILFEGVDE